MLCWGALYLPPVNFVINSKQVQQTEQAKQASEPETTKLESVGSSKMSDAARIGVAEATIQSLFEQPDIGFTFEHSSPVAGRPRIIGTSAHGLATIELIGQPANLTRAAITISIPDDNTDALTLNAEYVLRFIQNTAPQWAGGGDWVIQNLEAFAAGQKKAVKTTQAGKEISMTLIGEQEFLMITVKADQ